MTAFFLSIIERSLAASFVILAVIAARALTRRSPKWTRGVLWALVALRLILPFTLHSAVSLAPELPKFTGEEQISSTAVSPTGAPTAVDSVLSTVPPSVTNTVNSVPVGSAVQSTVPLSQEVQSTVPQNIVQQSTLAQDTTASESVQGASTADIAAIVWVAGAVLMLLYFAIGYARLWTQTRSATRTERGTWQCDQINSAFVFGVARPRIFLPGDIDPTAAEYMIAHERAHIRRGDHITKLLAFFLLAVHWFNPMVWLAYVLFCRDVELACDEYALRSIEPNRVSEYARTLLTVGAAPKSVAVYPLSFSRHSIQARIKNILNYKKPTVWAIAAAVVVCVITAACFATAPIVGDNSNTDAPSSSEADATAFTSDHTGESLFSYADAPVQSVEISWAQDTGRTARLTADADRVDEFARFATALRYCAPADADATLAGLTVTLTYGDDHTQTHALGTTTLDGTEYAVNIQEKTEFFALLREELAVYFGSDSVDSDRSAYTFLMLTLDSEDTLEWEQTKLTIRREGAQASIIDRTQCTVHTLECEGTKYLLISHGSMFDLQKDAFGKDDAVIILPIKSELELELEPEPEIKTKTKTETETEPEPKPEPEIEPGSQPKPKPEPEPEPEPEKPITVKWADAVPSGTAIQYGRGYGRTLDELPKSQAIDELTAAAPIICVRSWDEYTYVMSALLEDTESYENYIKYDPYDEDFFQDEALIILCQGSGPRKGWNERFIKSGSELCISTQIDTWSNGRTNPRVEWQGFTILTVSKAELSDIDTISLHVETIQHPNINDDFADDCVLVVVKDEYRDTVFTKEQFEVVGVELDSAECIASKVIYSLHLANKEKEEVLKAITKLEQLEFIKVAEPNYHVSIDWDV